MNNPNSLPQPDWRDDRSRRRKGNPHVPNIERDPNRVPDATEARINRAKSPSRILVLFLHFVVASLIFGGSIGLVTIVWTGDIDVTLAMFGGLGGGLVWSLAVLLLAK